MGSLSSCAPIVSVRWCSGVGVAPCGFRFAGLTSSRTSGNALSVRSINWNVGYGDCSDLDSCNSIGVGVNENVRCCDCSDLANVLSSVTP